MDDQRRDIELLEVFGEISLGECLDAVKGIFVATLHALQPEGIDYSGRDLGSWPVGPEERTAGYIFIELRSIGDRTLTELPSEEKLDIWVLNDQK